MCNKADISSWSLLELFSRSNKNIAISLFLLGQDLKAFINIYCLPSPGYSLVNWQLLNKNISNNENLVTYLIVNNFHPAFDSHTCQIKYMLLVIAQFARAKHSFGIKYKHLVVTYSCDGGLKAYFPLVCFGLIHITMVGLFFFWLRR